MGDDATIASAARVLASPEWRGQPDEKLIRYMYDNKHTSPFEHVIFTFYVKAPIFVFRQWHRHRTWSFNEISARYQELPDEWYVPPATLLGHQSAKNHQSRVITHQATEYDRARCREIDSVCEFASAQYKRLLKEGVPRELARGVLPVNTYSAMWATVDLHNLMHFFSLRLDDHAQYEIQVYAEAMLEEIRPIVPFCAELVQSNCKHFANKQYQTMANNEQSGCM
jgi:thymidylate synthase (FAD)